MTTSDAAPTRSTTLWQWRPRSGGLWRLHGLGEKPEHWWMQMEYREIPRSEYHRHRLDARLPD